LLIKKDNQPESVKPNTMPPKSLLNFSSLAIYLNSILQCFNDLRLCIPLTIFEDVKNQLNNSLLQLATSFNNYYKHERNTFDKNENDMIQFFLQLIAYELVPYLEKCLLLLFPIEQLQKVSSIPKTEMFKIKGFMNIDVKTVLAPIYDLIPEQEKKEEVQQDEETVIEQEVEEKEKEEEEVNKNEEKQTLVEEEETENIENE
jgi:conserved oligomeric Golgi complex subunit 8